MYSVYIDCQIIIIISPSKIGCKLVPLTCDLLNLEVAESKCRGATTSFLLGARVVLVLVMVALHVNAMRLARLYYWRPVSGTKGGWGWGVRPWGGCTCRCPGVLRASGTGKGAWYLHCMTRSRILYNVTQNNSGVEDPQYLSDLAYF